MLCWNLIIITSFFIGIQFYENNFQFNFHSYPLLIESTFGTFFVYSHFHSTKTNSTLCCLSVLKSIWIYIQMLATLFSTFYGQLQQNKNLFELELIWFFQRKKQQDIWLRFSCKWNWNMPSHQRIVHGIYYEWSESSSKLTSFKWKHMSHTHETRIKCPNNLMEFDECVYELEAVWMLVHVRETEWSETCGTSSEALC